MLRRNPPTLTTLSIEVPPASSTARTLSSVTRVCSARSCETTSLVTGSSGPCPDTKRNWPHLTPWAMGDSMPSEKPVVGAAFVYTTSGFMPTRVSCIDPSLTLETHRDLRRKGPGREPRAGLVRPRHPGAHLEAGRTLAVAHRHLVLHAEGLVLHLCHRRVDPHLVAVAHRRGEARPRLDDGHAHHAVFRKDLLQRQPQRLEERLGPQVEPLEEARVENYPRRIRLRPAHLHLDGMADHFNYGGPEMAPVLPQSRSSARPVGSPQLQKMAPVLPQSRSSARPVGSPQLQSAVSGGAHRFVSTCSFSLKRWSLPVAVRGSSLTMRMSRGRSWLGSVCSARRMSSDRSPTGSVAGSRGTTKTKGLMSPEASSAPTTPASSTAGCFMSAASTSAGTTHWPATLKKSSSRPQCE